MARFNLRSFAQPELLKKIQPANLLPLLEPFRMFLEMKGFLWNRKRDRWSSGGPAEERLATGSMAFGFGVRGSQHPGTSSARGHPIERSYRDRELTVPKGSLLDRLLSTPPRGHAERQVCGGPPGRQSALAPPGYSSGRNPISGPYQANFTGPGQTDRQLSSRADLGEYLCNFRKEPRAWLNCLP
jgi:hypothetical protein